MVDVCHPAGMNLATRVGTALGIGFIGYRISIALMTWPSAVLVGLIALGCTAALTAPRKAS